MKDMGEANVILGLKLTQSTEGITLSQSHYIRKSILVKYGYSNCRIASTHMIRKLLLLRMHQVYLFSVKILSDYWEFAISC